MLEILHSNTYKPGLPFFGITIQEYIKTPPETRCCMSDGRIHQLCHYFEPISTCKTRCEADTHCKGYTGAKDNSASCQIATSKKHSDCKFLYRKGNVGALAASPDCDGQYYFGGCYVKKLGMKTIIT